LFYNIRENKLSCCHLILQDISFWSPDKKTNFHKLKLRTKLRGFGPRANYTDRATAACWQSTANFCG
jgi:hypothetical protein